MLEKALAGYVAELGAVGIFALIALKLGLDYLKNVKKPDMKPPPSCPFTKREYSREWATFTKQWTEVYQWQRDDRNLAHVLERLTEAIEKQTEVSVGINQTSQATLKAIERVEIDMRGRGNC